MKFHILTAILFTALLVQSCSDSKTTSSDNLDSEFKQEIHDGMVFIPSRGKTVVLGNNSPDALSKESPQMKVVLDYSFFIDKHEVTCLEIPCKSDSVPVANVTYYDAVLFANARSNAEGKDTAYTYSSAKFDSDGNCIFLENLSFNPEAQAYRLPTEAEWVFAAQNGWDAKNSWNNGNSNYEVHKVCTKPANGFGLCDMAGNLKEFVNDWMGKYKDTTVTNYIGAPNGGSIDERVVKGGSFKNSPSTINTYQRGDTYTVTSSTKANYVGFRLAYGPIPDAVYISNDGQISSDASFIDVSASTIKKYLGTTRAKLAFRNDLSGNLAFIDFNKEHLSVTEIYDTLDSYHPDISPDGSKIAFSTGFEGIQSKSSIYVRNLSANGANLVKLDVESAAIPRWRIQENGDTVIVYVTSANDNTNDAEFKSQSTWQVPFSNGAFGTPEKLFDGAYHGGVSQDNQFAVSGSKMLRVRTGNQDSIWYNGEQACNVSLAKDDSKRTLFLDFGSKTGRDFVNEKYGVHQYILIADSTGKLIQAIEAPEEHTFDHTEWIGKDLIVATLANINEAHTQIVLIDSKTQDQQVLVSSGELWHPTMWIDSRNWSWNDSLANPDSLGVYYISGGSDRAKILRYRMESYWHYRDSANVIVIGSSRSSNGIDARYFSDRFKAINMSFFPSSMIDSKIIFDRYLDDATPQLKYLIVAFDPDLYFSSINESFFGSEVNDIPGYVYDANHQFWKTSETSQIYEATRNGMEIPEYKVFSSNNSTLFAPISGWGKVPEVDIDSTLIQSVLVENFDIQMESLKQLAQKGFEKDFYVVAVIFPQSPLYANTGAFGRHGMLRSYMPTIMDTLDSWQKRYPNFFVFDENKMGDHDYTDPMAQDYDHLSPLGALQLTERLNVFLEKLK